METSTAVPPGRSVNGSSVGSERCSVVLVELSVSSLITAPPARITTWSEVMSTPTRRSLVSPMMIEPTEPFAPPAPPGPVEGLQDERRSERRGRRRKRTVRSIPR